MMRAAVDIDHSPPRYHLYQRSRTPVWLALSWRTLLALALIGVLWRSIGSIGTA